MSIWAEYVMLGTSLASVAIWGALFGRALSHRRNTHDDLPMHRRSGMMLLGLLAAIGMAASGYGYLQGMDLVPLLSRDGLHYLAAVGRGAWFFGGLSMLLAHDPSAIDHRRRFR